MSANPSAVFNQKFFLPAVAGVAMVAAGCKLHFYLTGTTTAHNAFTDPTAVTPTANPLILDGDGSGTFYLDPAVLYRLVLKDSADVATLNTWDNVGAAALATGTVVSINGLTGIVVLDSSGIPYTTSSGATWLTADNVESALDQIATRANSPPASSVTLVDAGGFFPTDDVEDALQFLGGKAVGSKLLRITPFLSSGTATWTPGTGTNSVFIRAVGGGGGSNTSTVGAGGGGGGGAAEGYVAAPGSSVTVTVGAGGAAGSAGSASSFGSLVAASGGAAGGATKGGLGGVGTVGDIIMRGMGGGWGAASGTLNLFGHGGASPFGGGARGNVGGGSGDGASQAGDANTGGGGSGGTSGGAAGGSGAVWVFEYS